MNKHHSGPVNVQAESVVLVDFTEELPSVPQMNQDSLLAKFIAKHSESARGRRVPWRITMLILGKTISMLRWFASIKKLKSKLTQVLSDSSTANSEWRKEKAEMDTSWWTCFGFSEHQSRRRWGNIMDCRGSTSADQTQTPRKLLIGWLPWVASTHPIKLPLTSVWYDWQYSEF